MADHDRLPAAWGPWWGRPVGRVLDHVLYNTKVAGASRVPRTGPVIFAANHLSYLDGPVLVGAAPRHMHVLVKQEMFKGFLGAVLTASGQLPVDRAGDRRTLQRAKALLTAGRCVGILPEGTRGNGDASSVNSGVAWLALNSSAPVVPVAVLGTRISGEHRDAVPPLRRRLHVVFGEPVRVERPAGLPGRAAMEHAVEEIRSRLAAHVAFAVATTGQQLPDDNLYDLAGAPAFSNKGNQP